MSLLDQARSTQGLPEAVGAYQSLFEQINKEQAIEHSQTVGKRAIES